MREVRTMDKIRSRVLLVLAAIWLVGSIVISNGIIDYSGTLFDAIDGGEYARLWAIVSIPLTFMCLFTWVITVIIAIATNVTAKNREKYLKNGCYKQYENSFMVTNIVTTILFLVAALISMIAGVAFYEGGELSYITDSVLITVIYRLTIHPIIMLLEMLVVFVFGIIEFVLCLTNKGDYAGMC